MKHTTPDDCARLYCVVVAFDERPGRFVIEFAHMLQHMVYTTGAFLFVKEPIILEYVSLFIDCIEEEGTGSSRVKWSR